MCPRSQTLSFKRETRLKGKSSTSGTLGIKHDEPTVHEKFIEDITQNGERYEVKLPFKENHPILPDNYQLSKTTLESLLRQLKSKPEVLKHYDQVIQEQLKKNIVEPVNIEE